MRHHQSEGSPEVDGGGGLPDATFLVEYAQYFHTAFLDGSGKKKIQLIRHTAIKNIIISIIIYTKTVNNKVKAEKNAVLTAIALILALMYNNPKENSLSLDQVSIWPTVKAELLG
jgi:hypothetical protein